ncbi:AsmA family protein [Belnapia sp. T6]|uniref:AsmA family protein n=1 Tax=Belnapia mucosa TaxID=2804532 RepID=A0ABS1V9C1_9PROT|nr:AsmA family protein [Belnapia mucosa]MBL6457339.1 AsmA family protein [Belnapia mucosa]
MRRLAVFLLPWLALLGAAIWVGPRLLDWEPYRAQLADIASTQLGRPVTLGGRITLTLLPQPRVEAAAVAIGANNDGLAITARAMRLRLDLPALLAGRLEPREIALVGGEISLPWPPTALPGLRPPPWFGALDARLEDCRLKLGGLQFEALNARLQTGDLAEALTAEGSLAWRGYAIRFSGQLGRAGFDGIAPLDLSLALAGATFTARGVLASDGFEGRMEAAGPDLSVLLPAPPGAFRATGRLTAAAELFAADDLSLDLGGQPARGAATLRLSPAPRLDVALAAGRLDLDAWLAALRPTRGGGRPLAVPVSIDLSAESTGFGGVPLRRLRGGFFIEGDRLTLSDVSALLPGDMELDVAGASAGPRMELALRFAGPSLRDTLAALGLPLSGTDPARLRAAEGRFRLVLEEGQAAISDIAATIDGTRLAGDGVVRAAQRLSVGLGLTLDRLDLNGLLPTLTEVPGLDLNLRLAADRVAWRDLAAERAVLDASLESGRLTLRRLAFRLGELDLAASGSAQLGGSLRLPDLSVELSGPTGAALQPLAPAAWAPLLAQPIALRLSGSGVPEAVALRAEGDLGGLRLEAAANLDARARRGNGTLTLRHPGAPRLLAPLLGPGAEWLGEGSFSLIASLAGQMGATPGFTADRLDLVAGTLRLRSQLALALTGPRPRLTGRIEAERLPLPAPVPGSPAPLGLDRLGLLDAELAVEAGRVEPLDWPPLTNLAGTLKLDGGVLRLEGAQARLAGGTLRGGLSVDSTATPPRLGLEAQLADATLGEPLFGLPFDLGAGRVEAQVKLQAAGHSMAALAATLNGTAALAVRDGVLTGLDLSALHAAAGLAEPEAPMRAALAGGATAFERLEAAASLDEGRATLTAGSLATEGGGAASLGGSIDLARGALDLRIAARPLADAPEVGLRLTGPATEPRRLAELAPFLLWRAAQP